MSALVICACREKVAVWVVMSLEPVTTWTGQQPAEHAQHTKCPKDASYRWFANQQ
jgi:hypothetical protein